MKCQIVLSVGLTAIMAAPIQAQVTHVMSFQTGMTGRHERMASFSDMNTEHEMGVSLITESEQHSTQTVNANTGKTETYQYETQATSMTLEEGERRETIDIQFYEAYDYSDSGVSHEVTFEF